MLALLFEIFAWIFDDSRLSFTRNSRSDTDWPELARNFWNSAGFGNCWALIVSNCFLTSLSLTFTTRLAASPTTPCEEIRKPSTSCCRDLYCCSHWDFSCAVVGGATPLAGFGVIACRCAMQA